MTRLHRNVVWTPDLLVPISFPWEYSIRCTLVPIWNVSQAARRRAVIRSAKALAVHDDTLSHGQRRELLHLAGDAGKQVTDTRKACKQYESTRIDTNTTTLLAF